jgi:hypothetical protein
MSPSFLANGLTATIPALVDSANIVTAFQDYHTSISDDVAVLARANTFTNTNTIDAANSLVFKDASNIGGRLIASSGVLYLQAGSSSGDTAAELRITRYSSASNISALKLYADNTTLYGTLNLVAGTASIAPIKLVSGTNLTTPAAGVIEYNGQFFVTNNTTTKRGLVSPRHIYSLTAQRSLSTAGGTQSLFGVGLALEANTVYEFDLWFRLTSQTSASGSNTTISISLELPTSSVGDSESTYSASFASTASSRTFNSNESTPLTSGIITYTGTSATQLGQYHMKGMIRTSSSAGNFIPKIVIGNATNLLSTLIMGAGAYVTVNKIGASDADISIGGWA